MSLSMKIWLPLSLIYILFFLWYTNLSGPLSDQEIAAYKEMYEESNRDSYQWERAFKFMSEDDGKDFYMVNFLDSNESPRTMEATGEGATSLDLSDALYGIYVAPTIQTCLPSSILFLCFESGFRYCCRPRNGRVGHSCNI